jgi:hypothetical protein
MGIDVKTGKFLLAASISLAVMTLGSVGCGGGGDNSPGRASGGVETGVWGSSDAEVDATNDSSKLLLNCSANPLPAIMPDSNGDFAFTADYGDPPLLIKNAQYNGHIQGSSMALTVTDPSSNHAIKTYDLTLGVTKPPFMGVCPASR